MIPTWTITTYWIWPPPTSVPPPRPCHRTSLALTRPSPVPPPRRPLRPPQVQQAVPTVVPSAVPPATRRPRSSARPSENVDRPSRSREATTPSPASTGPWPVSTSAPRPAASAASIRPSGPGPPLLGQEDRQGQEAPELEEAQGQAQAAAVGVQPVSVVWVGLAWVGLAWVRAVFLDCICWFPYLTLHFCRLIQFRSFPFSVSMLQILPARAGPHRQRRGRRRRRWWCRCSRRPGSRGTDGLRRRQEEAPPPHGPREDRLRRPGQDHRRRVEDPPGR